jgi:methylated-DNA-protein-cysteine methyltransferase related protein
VRSTHKHRKFESFSQGFELLRKKETQMEKDPVEIQPLYKRIYAIVRQIPPGRVASYGQIARIVGGCTPRMVGYALSALKNSPIGEGVPWQRVINAQGKISPFGDGFGSAIQRQLLEGEGIHFDLEGNVDFDRVGWLGPV